MKRNAMWVLPGLLAVATLGWTAACSSTDDGVVGDPDASTGTDAGSKDRSAPSDDSGTVDDASSDADADATVEEDTDAGPPDRYAEACARIDACATATGTRSGMNGCYELMTAAPFAQQLDPIYRAQLQNLKCKLAAKTCVDVQKCDKPNADYVTACANAAAAETPRGELCDGNVFVVCDLNNGSAPLLAVDCAATGEICGDSGFATGCGKATCDQMTSTPACKGNTLTVCSVANVTNEVDCKTSSIWIPRKPVGVTVAGEVCGVDRGDHAGEDNCIGAGAECDGLSSRCDGTVLETCAGGYISRRDCSKLLPAGQGCVVLEDGPMAGTTSCGPINPSCHVTDNETCNPTTGMIGFCGLTGPKKVNCKALGHAGCKTTTVNGRVTAACFQ